MRLDFITGEIRKSQGYIDIDKGVSSGRYPVGVYGVSESARAALIASFYEDHDRSVFVISHSELEARNIYKDLMLYENDVFYLPAREPVFYNPDAVSGDLRWERLKVLKKVSEVEKKIIVTSAESLVLKYMPARYLKEYTFHLKTGDVLNLEILKNRLLDSGYEGTEIVEKKGQFALRGGIIDIYSPVEPFPVRIEMFSDEIDSIRTFNPDTQRSVETIKETDIFPSKEIIISKEALERGRDRIREELQSIQKNKAYRKNIGEEGFTRLKETVSSNLESLQEKWTFDTIDSYLNFFYDMPETFFDYVGDGFIFIDDSGRTMGKTESMFQEFSQQYEMFLKRGDILPSQNGIIISSSEIADNLCENKTILLNEILKSERYIQPKSLSKFNETTVHNFQGQLDYLTENIRDRKERGYRVLVLAGTRSRGERLEENLKDEGIEAVYKDNPGEISERKVVITFGSSIRGFDFNDIRLSVITDSDIFREKPKEKGRRRAQGKGIEKIKSFEDLRKGDYVVHVNHGIGIYMGIKQIKSQDVLKDYLEIAYQGKDRIYIPVDQLDLIQKYIGNESANIKISKLGTDEWTRKKARVSESVDKVAREIVELYAKRSRIKGYEFSKDTPWQRDFEEEFEFEETEDQIASTEEIKKDMESPRVMDRLLCGDVGYGKTEVAMRAAFKAVMDGKQVAVLVPTTILAEQHYKTFRRRFEGFSVNIDMLSRFRTAKQAKEAVEALRNGTLDIIIGTHKLLAKNVVFRDLGLLIIDEEQRFGVKQKERIKELKTSIDVLTLSATPIPRTLNMSMTGVRDISLIETPPEDRFPIQTYVTEYNDQLIRDAILREKSRNGQVYFVYNAVERMDSMLSHLRKLVPEVEIRVGHGQLTERELEEVMLSFMEGEFDVLLCSTIIETGLDINNVNTLIVYDSDKFGLSQLYQLRGRVGRFSRIAYAYLTYRKDKVLTEVAEKRLKALKDFTELGAGFKIAMKDLEIRGAGNMMGKAQHGQMAEVGYDLYIRMLDEAVRRLSGNEEINTQDTVIDIKVDAYIPYEYISDEVLKIQMYKKIAAIENKEDYFRVKSEMEDRFSDIPDVVYNLMDISILRSLAKQAGVTEIRERPQEVVISFINREAITDGYIGVLTGKYAKIANLKNTDPPQIGFRNSGKKEKTVAELTKLMERFLESRPPEDKK